MRNDMFEKSACRGVSWSSPVARGSLRYPSPASIFDAAVRAEEGPCECSYRGFVDGSLL